MTNRTELYQKTYQQIHGQDPPTSVEKGESAADVVSQPRGFLSGFDGTLQFTVGCPAGCLFCYVPSRPFLTPDQVRGDHGTRWGYQWLMKVGALDKFRRHLDRGRLADRTWYWSGVTDPYVSSPEVTRALWQSVCAAPADLRPRRIVVQTRFRPDRDAKLIAEYCHTTQPADDGPAVVVSYSLGTDRNDLIRAWERATPLFEDRMEAIHALRKKELFVVVTLSPFSSWHDLKGTLIQLRRWGVLYLTVLFFKVNTPSANTPQRFQAYLQSHHAELLDPAWQADQLRQIRAVYGDRFLEGQHGFDSLTDPQKFLTQCGPFPPIE
jgi:DNA repair photolyase